MEVVDQLDRALESLRAEGIGRAVEADVRVGELHDGERGGSLAVLSAQERRGGGGGGEAEERGAAERGAGEAEEISSFHDGVTGGADFSSRPGGKPETRN